MIIDNDIFLTNTAYFIDNNSKYLLALLNSKLIFFYYKLIVNTLGEKAVRYFTQYVEQIPIPEIPLSEQKPYELLVEYVLWLKANEGLLVEVEDKVMSGYFERMIDGCVYELYFGEEMRKSEKDILQYLGELPQLSAGNELETIRGIFKILRNPKHPVRVRLYYMDSMREIRIIEGKHVQ